MNCFSLYGSNNSGSIVFENGGFGEIKDHSLKTTSLQKKKQEKEKTAMEVLRLCLPDVKSYFQ